MAFVQFYLQDLNNFATKFVIVFHIASVFIKSCYSVGNVKFLFVTVTENWTPSRQTSSLLTSNVMWLQASNC